MTPLNVCPACSRLNPPDAAVCVVCAAELLPEPEPEISASGEPAVDSEPSAAFVDLTRIELDVDTTPAVHLDAPELQRWFDSRTGTTDVRHDEADTAATPLDLTLRPIDDVPVLNDVAEPADTLPPGLIQSDPDSPPTYVADERAQQTSATAPSAAPPITKATRRAAVRRRRLAGKPTSADAVVLADVLVLEGDDSAREQLCGLLEGFGFRVHPVQTAVQAARMLAAKHFVAAFLDLKFDGVDQPASIELCGRVKSPGPQASGRVSALIVVSGSTRPVERVRASLTGSDAFVVKPVNRGSVAQALETCGVALPTDSRRG